MKKNRNLFYANNQTGGYFNPNMSTPNMMPSGFNQNTNYMAYGPGVGPNGVINPNDQLGYGYIDEENIDNRLLRIEKQIRKLEDRVSRLEANSDLIIEDTTNNMYMI